MIDRETHKEVALNAVYWALDILVKILHNHISRIEIEEARDAVRDAILALEQAASAIRRDK
jgi:hypothetical protein